MFTFLKRISTSLLDISAVCLHFLVNLHLTYSCLFTFSMYGTAVCLLFGNQFQLFDRYFSCLHFVHKLQLFVYIFYTSYLDSAVCLHFKKGKIIVHYFSKIHNSDLLHYKETKEPTRSKLYCGLNMIALQAKPRGIFIT